MHIYSINSLVKNKTLIDVLEAGEMSIEEYHRLQEYKMEVLKKQLDKKLQMDIEKENKELLKKNGIEIEEPKPEVKEPPKKVDSDFVPNWKKKVD